MKSKPCFVEAMAGVTPLKGRSRVVGVGAPGDTPGLEARRRAATSEPGSDANFLSTDYAPPVGPHDIVGFVRPGVQHGVYARLRRGRYPAEATLDLHRHSAEEARRELWHFVQQSVRYQLRTVMVLHGKGDRAPRAAVLKSFVCHWLKDMPPVLAYHSARPCHGGAGALYILLKKSQQAREDNRERYLKKRHD